MEEWLQNLYANKPRFSVNNSFSLPLRNNSLPQQNLSFDNFSKNFYQKHQKNLKGNKFNYPLIFLI